MNSEGKTKMNLVNIIISFVEWKDEWVQNEYDYVESRRHKTLNQRWFNVAPLSTTLNQR